MIDTQIRVNGELAYILQAIPHRETSSLLDVLTKNHGRVTLVARGARRPRSDLRGVILPFQPITVSWFGKNELKTLHRAEWMGGVPAFSGKALVSAFYLNELVIKLTAKEDPHTDLYHLYDVTIRQLACCGDNPALPLRRFEAALLRALGYLPDFSLDQNGQAVLHNQYYEVRADALPLPYSKDLSKNPLASRQSVLVLGQTLLGFSTPEQLSSDRLKEMRQITRLIIDYQLGYASLNSRTVLNELSQSYNRG